MRVKILYYGGWTITRLVSKLIFRIRISGWEHVPRQRGFLLASNHISYYDPLLLGSWSPREMYFFAKRELFKNKIFGGIIRRTNALPVNRGAVDRESIRTAVATIQSGFGLVFFPEGTRSKTDDFLPAKPGLGMIAQRARCPIVPVYLHGSNRLKDCFRGRTRMSVTFGKPIPVAWLETLPKGKEGYRRVSEEAMRRIAAIKSEVLSC